VSESASPNPEDLSRPLSERSDADSAPTETRKKRGIMRRLYEWVLHWAHTPYGSPALGVLAFAESSFFPIPPDVLLIPLTLSRRNKWVYYATLCTMASVVGGIAGYAIGALVWNQDWVQHLFYAYIPGFDHAVFDQVQRLYDEWDWVIVFTAGVTPIPFKVITITAGAFGINLFAFVGAAMVGRAFRFYLVAWLVHRYGARAQRIIDKHFNLLCIAFVILLVAGFYFITYVMHDPSGVPHGPK